MGVLDLESNAPIGENGTGKLYIATDYDNVVFDEGNGTNEATIITDIEADYVFADVGYFENFNFKIKQGDEKIISTDYDGVGEISRKSDKVPGFSVDVQEILEMDNLALILGETLATTGTTPNEVETIVMKRKLKTKPYQLFKFVSAPKDGKYNIYYFVKNSLSSDIEIPFTNLKKNDFAGVTLEFETADNGNCIIKKGIAVV